MGHGALIAQKHYLQVTDDDFDRAASRGVDTVQKPAQHGATPSHTGPYSPLRILALWKTLCLCVIPRTVQKCPA
jgi:hypothetical protein